MNKLLKSLRGNARSGVFAMLVVVIATPACMSSHRLGSGTVPAYAQATSVRQRYVAPESAPTLASPTEQLATSNPSDQPRDTIHDEADDESCSNALYWADEPISSRMEHTSAADLEQMCADEKSSCMTRCLNNPKPPYPAQKKGDRAHFALCHKRCFKQFMECIRKAGLLQEFSVLDAALAWIKSHGKEIVGTIVIIGGVAYVVSTGGSGALVLVVL